VTLIAGILPQPEEINSIKSDLDPVIAERIKNIESEYFNGNKMR
jgi:hypothetical protein